jgi:hypothetical protein
MSIIAFPVIQKTPYLTMYNAGVVVLVSKVVGLAPELSTSFLPHTSDKNICTTILGFKQHSMKSKKNLFINSLVTLIFILLIK